MSSLPSPHPTAALPPRPPPSGTSAFTLADLAATLVQRRGRLSLATLAVALVTAAILLWIPERYTARISIVPESRSGASAGQLAGLAALAGLTLSAGAAGPLGQTPQFYASLLTSRPITYAVLNRRYPDPRSDAAAAGGDSAALVEIFRPQGDTPAERLWDAARRLNGDVDVRTDIRTGIVTLSFEHTSPELAASVAAAFVQELERFNREARQSQARARRRFTEERVADAGRDLRTAEDSLRRFLSQNRQFEASPTLRFEHGRLQRALAVQQELYLQLRRELDAARIAEVDDIPMLTVVEPAVVPQRRSAPARRKWFAIVLVVALGAQTAWYVLADHHARLAPSLAPTLRVFSPRLAERLAKIGRPAG